MYQAGREQSKLYFIGGVLLTDSKAGYTLFVYVIRGDARTTGGRRTVRINSLGERITANRSPLFLIREPAHTIYELAIRSGS